MSSITTPTTSSNVLKEKAGAAARRGSTQRYHPAAGMRKQFNKVFPDALVVHAR